MSLLGGVFVILVLGISLIKWQSDQGNSDRIRQAMTDTIQQSATNVSDLSSRTNNTDLKTLRIKSLNQFMDEYYRLYNANSAIDNKSNLQNKNNSKFNFYLMDGQDVKSIPSAGINKGVSVYVVNGQIKSLGYYTSDTVIKTITDADTIKTMLTLDQAVNIKMVKVRALFGSRSYDATAALSLKRSPVASPVSNKLDDLTVPNKTPVGSDLFKNNINVRNSLGSLIDPKDVTVVITNSAGEVQAQGTVLTDSSYTATYEATDTAASSQSGIKIVRKILVDQNLPLIESPMVVTDYISADPLVGARAYEMPNGANGSRGIEITSRLTQNLSKSDLMTVGSHDQTLEVTDSNGKHSILKRKLVLKANTPVLTATSDSIGEYLVGRGPNTTELAAGITASSPKDGNLISLLKIDVSQVNANIPGTYNVVYSVASPTGGEVTTLTRTITFTK